MPPVTIYTKSKDSVVPITKAFSGLKQIIANELSCTERQLTGKDIHTLVLVPEAFNNSADTRIDIQAYHYPDRIKRQDDICNNIKKYMSENCKAAGSIDVFLYLGELGYSFEK